MEGMEEDMEVMGAPIDMVEIMVANAIDQMMTVQQMMDQKGAEPMIESQGRKGILVFERVVIPMKMIMEGTKDQIVV
ncbi:hypothetical protein SUGI_1066120 [Cryptomeria japonica]|nr:hypothetical protein SUGI_1066120 [Cryptomeria japonica]